MFFLKRINSFSPTSSTIAYSFLQYQHRSSISGISISSINSNNAFIAKTTNKNKYNLERRALFSTTNNDNNEMNNNNKILKEMYKDSKSILWSGINEVKPNMSIKNNVSINNNILHIKESTYDLSKYENIVLFGIGKASSGMTYEVATIINDNNTNKIDGGIVITKDNHATKEEINYLHKNNITIYEASHPIPDERCVRASNKLLDLAKHHSKMNNNNTLIICCISGGGSSLFCTPDNNQEIHLNSIIQTNKILLQSGMDIQSMNVIRKCLEIGKGGGLASIFKTIHDNTLITLLLSDVINDDLHSIASGPTVFPTDTADNQYALANNIIKQYNLQSALPNEVIQLIQNEASTITATTATKSINDNNNNNINNDDVFLVGNNALAVTAAANKAKSLGYKPIILSTNIQGEAKEVGKVLIYMASSLIQNNDYPITSTTLPVCLIAGGETTVTLPSDNKGIGGRNQELGLSAAITLHELAQEQQQQQQHNYNNIVFTSIGTDGTDGPTDCAGVSVDSHTITRIKEQCFNHQITANDALKYHDAYNYFYNYNNNVSHDDDDDDDDEGQDHLGDGLIYTNATGTNVADIYFTLIR